MAQPGLEIAIDCITKVTAMHNKLARVLLNQARATEIRARAKARELIATVTSQIPMLISAPEGWPLNEEYIPIDFLQNLRATFCAAEARQFWGWG